MVPPTGDTRRNGPAKTVLPSEGSIKTHSTGKASEHSSYDEDDPRVSHVPLGTNIQAGAGMGGQFPSPESSSSRAHPHHQHQQFSAGGTGTSCYAAMIDEEVKDDCRCGKPSGVCRCGKEPDALTATEVEMLKGSKGGAKKMPERKNAGKSSVGESSRMMAARKEGGGGDLGTDDEMMMGDDEGPAKKKRFRGSNKTVR